MNSERAKLFKDIKNVSKNYIKAMKNTTKTQARVRVIFNQLNKDVNNAEKKHMTKEHKEELKKVLKKPNSLKKLKKQIISLDKKHSTTPFLKRRLAIMKKYTKKF